MLNISGIYKVSAPPDSSEKFVLDGVTSFPPNFTEKDSDDTEVARLFSIIKGSET